MDVAEKRGSPREAPFRLGDKWQWLYGLVYAPASGEAGDRCCLFLNPLDNEANTALRFYVRMARCLADMNIWSVRFDYRGTGNSSGSFSDVSFDTMIEDICRIKTYLIDRYGITVACLAGARFGGTVALVYCACRRDVSELVLWDPVLDVQAYFKTYFINLDFGQKRVGRGPGFSLR